jgi:UDP-N-acetylmuramate dehydrogenase
MNHRLLQVSHNISLKPLNTFGMDVIASQFVEITEASEISNLLKDPETKKLPRLILGGGSNILFTANFEGIVFRNRLKGIEVVQENEREVRIKAASGEIWHELVQYCIAHNYGGIENLSLIPGTVGAAPIQNIGAYGVELKDVFESLEALNLNDCTVRTFTAEECRFGYRDSIFKREAKDKYFILSVTLKLQKFPDINTTYGAIQKMLESWGITDPGIADVSEAVCTIRRSKLPDPAVIGNAGSFFKNPEIATELFSELKKQYPDIHGYPAPSGVKVPAGWLIESLGWKGKRVGETGSHKDQALVLVNYGHAKGAEVQALAMEIQRSVIDKYGIVLAPEVNII